ncbi:MAG: amino acid ABC transporter ATP-binding protein [Deltaproteobacteria bacterium]|nr:amino acid ABC transporter ATP-binding protein [Deltaproteobacteria bacterium]
MIRVQGLTKKYGARTVIQDLSFEVPSGQVVALVGPSGGGKSTLIRCLHGLEPFDGGQIEIDQATLSPGALGGNHHALHAIRRVAGFVFQQWHLFSHMSALANVMEAPVQVKQEPRAQAEAKARALLEKVGMGHRVDAMPRRLSGGEQQRVAIARALAMEPTVLFLDEPTSALDPQRVGDLVDLLRQLAKEGLTLLTVTHDLRFAAQLCGRALIFAEGQIVEDGPPAQVLKDPQDPRARAFLDLEEG